MPEDLAPSVERRSCSLGAGPKLPQGIRNESDAGSFSWGDMPTPLQKLDQVVGVGAALQMVCQRQVKEVGPRAVTLGAGLFGNDILPGGVGAQLQSRASRLHEKSLAESPDVGRMRAKRKCACRSIKGFASMQFATMQPEPHNGDAPQNKTIPPLLATAPPPVISTHVQAPPVIPGSRVSPGTGQKSKTESKPTPPPIPPQPKTVSPLKPPKSPRIKGLKIVISIIILGIVVLLGFFLVTTPASKTNPVRGFTSGIQLLTKDTREDFLVLCETLFEKIKLEGSFQLSEAEARIKVESNQAEIRGISQRGKNLGKIAQGLIYLESKRQNVAANAPDGKALASGFLDLASGLKNDNGADLWAGLQKAWPDIASGAKTILGAADLMDQKHMFAIVLATKCAPQFSGPTTNASLLKCSFAEHQPIIFETSMIQQLRLTNTSGRDLHDCVVFVRASDPDGKSYVNITSVRLSFLRLRF